MNTICSVLIISFQTDEIIGHANGNDREEDGDDDEGEGEGEGGVEGGGGGVEEERETNGKNWKKTDD